jgi:hypothetical protein
MAARDAFLSPRYTSLEREQQLHNYNVRRERAPRENSGDPCREGTPCTSHIDSLESGIK